MTVGSIAAGLAIGVTVVRLARRIDTTTGWAAVGVVALALVVSGYGLLHRLLCAGGPRCGPSASGSALVLGGVLGLVSLGYLIVVARR